MNFNKWPLFFFAVGSIFLLTGCEIEGTVKTEDCRKMIEIEEGSYKTYYKKFYCDYQKTSNGKIMGGSCLSTETTSFFDKCTKVFLYNKKPELSCAKETPYLGYDEKCYKEWDIGRVDASEK